MMTVMTVVMVVVMVTAKKTTLVLRGWGIIALYEKVAENTHE